MHPVLFAGVYKSSSLLCDVLKLSPWASAEVLLAAPKVTQAIIAAIGDYYTFKLAERIYGKGSNVSYTAVRSCAYVFANQYADSDIQLALTVCSPWQWFCSIRTLSNCLETVFTTVALYYWPWQWTAPESTTPGLNNRLIPVESPEVTVDETTR
jgi:GPI mannosyltransferase 3